MKRRIATLGIVGVLALAGAGSADAGGDQKAVKSAAKRAASRYVEKFGIYYSPSMWKAKCHHKGGKRWKCKVTSQPPQCKGKVRLKRRKGGRFKAYRRQIGCAE